MENKNRQKLFSGFLRLGNFALDRSGIHSSLHDAETYIKNDRTAYVGQIIAVVDDKINKENNGIYFIRDENGVLVLEKSLDIETVRKEIRAAADELSKSLTKAFEEADKKLGQELRENIASLNDKDKEHDNSIAEINKEIINEKNLRDEQHSVLQHAIDELSDRLDILKGSEDLDEALDSISEISKWLEAHGEDFDNLDAIVDQGQEDIKQLKKDTSLLDDRLKIIEANGSTNEAEVRDLAKEEIQAAFERERLSSVDKNLEFLLDIPLSGASLEPVNYHNIPSSELIFKPGDIIKSVNIQVIDRALEQLEFQIKVGDEIVLNSKDSITYPDLAEDGSLINVTENVRLIDITVNEDYELPLYYVVEKGGTLNLLYNGSQAKIRLLITYNRALEIYSEL